tara:strand:+ start:9269 stop:9790 length:522 start_codon:yes stop_codon:yes gene_type:complete
MKPKFKKRNTLLLIGMMGALSLPVVAANNGLVGSTVYEVVHSANVSEMKGSLGATNIIKVVNSLVGLDNEVLIQGAEVSVLKDLVESIGGVVTHKLPLVGGIGARVSDTQLVILTQLAPLIKVSKNEAVFTSGSLDNCLVYGSHVVELTENKIRWNLYNARDKQANMESMSFT